MQLNPGFGYTFTSSASGQNLTIDQPWAPYSAYQAPSPCPLQIYNLRYDSTAAVYYINISPGMVNNLGVTDHDDNPLTDLPAPNIQVFEDGLTAEMVTNYVYIACQISTGGPPINYPDPEVPPYITIKTDPESDTNDTGFLLIGIVQGSTDTETDVDTLNTFNYKGCGSLWTTRFKCGSNPAQYWWSAT